MLLLSVVVTILLLTHYVHSKAILLQDDMSTVQSGRWSFWPPYQAPVTSSYCPQTSSGCFQIGGTGWFSAQKSTKGYKDIVIQFDINNYGYTTNADYCQLIYTTDFGISWHNFGPQYTTDTSDTLTLTPPAVQDSDYFGFGWKNYATSESKLCFISNTILSATLPNTNNPSQEPTKAPSIDPTPSPSYSPTTPTKTPSNNPTINPTLSPTYNPSHNPTNSPTNNPTSKPTNNPTHNPSNNPSINPSITPSNIPTLKPTKHPTQHVISLNTSVISTTVAITSTSVAAEGNGAAKAKGSQMSLSNYIPAMIVVLFFVLICILGIYHSKKHNYQFMVSNMIWFAYHSLDFFTDVLFVLFLFHSGEIGLFIIGLIFMVFSSVVSVIQLNINMKEWISDYTDSIYNDFFNDYATFLYALCFVVGCQSSIHLCTSNFMKLRVFGLNLSKYHRTKLYSAHLWSMVVCENIPQLILEIIYITHAKTINDITLLAMVFSGCSILMAPCIYITHRQLMNQHKISETQQNNYVELHS